MPDFTSSLLPSNSADLEHALDTVAKRNTALPVQIDSLFNPDTCPAHLLGHLAWSLAIDYWRNDWSEAIKRQVCRNAIIVHRYKGTAYAVRVALEGTGVVTRVTGVVTRVTEWFEGGDQPYTFKVETPLNQYLSELDQRAVFNSIVRTKNVRSSFMVVLPVAAVTGVGVQAVARPLLFRRLESLIL